MASSRSPTLYFQVVTVFLKETAVKHSKPKSFLCVCRQITETPALLWMYLEKFKIKCTASVVHNVEVIFQTRKFYENVIL